MIKDLIGIVKELTELLKELGPLIIAGGVTWGVILAEINRRRTTKVEAKVDAVAAEQAVAAEKVIEVKDALVVAGEKRDHQLETVVAKLDTVQVAVADNTQKTELIADSISRPT